MNVKEAFAIVLRKERKKIGLTQADLAGLCDLDPETIGLYERGQRQPTLNTLLKLADALDVEAEYLVTEVKKHLKSK
ncbi:helix-turn-helix transcriptional regulator [Fulvivirgaceae bacterium BMA12]|uniref:Helix-turn-helix transcriptional regulator n=1 Tax=Agaribacillus aureus TaxID=3051825 RepID=A0ABT8LB49_9BACT|nr:helix-turn-helix transcriptional regulator [Fulvivirgaceae bacterium BMA12]